MSASTNSTSVAAPTDNNRPPSAQTNSAAAIGPGGSNDVINTRNYGAASYETEMPACTMEENHNHRGSNMAGPPYAQVNFVIHLS